jgi:hypothetical protein
MAIGRSLPCTIATSATDSTVIELGELTLVGIYTPSTFDGTALTIAVCDARAGTYVPLTDPDTGASVPIVAAASKYYAIDPVLTLGAQFAKLVAGTAQSTTDTVLTVVVKPFAG